MRNLLLVTSLCLAAAVGCGPSGPPMGTVSGKLTIAGGAPKEPTRITFVSNSIGHAAGARIGEGGAYALEAPLPLSEYKVFVSRVPADTGEPIPTAQEILMSVPKEYRSEETTPLKHQVKEGANEINIEIPGVEARK